MDSFKTRLALWTFALVGSVQADSQEMPDPEHLHHQRIETVVEPYAHYNGSLLTMENVHLQAHILQALQENLANSQRRYLSDSDSDYDKSGSGSGEVPWWAKHGICDGSDCSEKSNKKKKVKKGKGSNSSDKSDKSKKSKKIKKSKKSKKVKKDKCDDTEYHSECSYELDDPRHPWNWIEEYENRNKGGNKGKKSGSDKSGSDSSDKTCTKTKCMKGP